MEDNKTKFILPGAILLAALIISGTLVYTRQLPAGKNPAQIGSGQEQPAASAIDIKIGPTDHILGNKNAKVTIVEFADFRCPFCERFFKQSEQSLINEYINTGKASFIFKNYAFLGPESVLASQAAECASEQDKFWQFHDWLYNNQASESDLAYYSKENLVKYGAKIGLDAGKFSSCLNQGKYSKKVSDELAEGQKYGVSGTPTVFINGAKIVGAQPYEVFKAAIDSALK